MTAPSVSIMNQLQQQPNNCEMVSAVDADKINNPNDNHNDDDQVKNDNSTKHTIVGMNPATSFGTSSVVNTDMYNDTMSVHKKRLLPIDFVISDHDVLCGRGSKCYNHIGNQRFRTIVNTYLTQYMNAKCKYDKTAIIYEIINQIRSNCSPINNGGFIKWNTSNGRLYEVGDFLAVSYHEIIVSSMFDTLYYGIH